MTDEKNYEVANGLWIGTKYGDLRRERAALIKKLVSGDNSVKYRLYELILEIEDHLRGRK